MQAANFLHVVADIYIGQFSASARAKSKLRQRENLVSRAYKS